MIFLRFVFCRAITPTLKIKDQHLYQVSEDEQIKITQVILLEILCTYFSFCFMKDRSLDSLTNMSFQLC